PEQWTNLKWLGRTLLLAAALVAPLVQGARALADDLPAIPCRSDPVLVVNGAIVDLASALWADPSAIREVDYQVTIPSGTLLGSIRLTVGLSFPEVVTYVVSPNQPWGSVRIAASVRLQDGAATFPL